MNLIYRAEIKVFQDGQVSIGENMKDLTIQEAQTILQACILHEKRLIETMKKQIGVSEIEYIKQILGRNPELKKIPTNS